MDAAGAAVDELADPGGHCLLEADARAADVDIPVVLFGDVHLAEGGGDVLDDVDALHAAADTLAVGHRADDHLSAPVAQFPGLQAFLVVHGDNLVPHVKQAPDKRLAGESCAARH